MAELLEYRKRLGTVIKAAKKKAGDKYQLKREEYQRFLKIFENVDKLSDFSDCFISDLRVPFDGDAEVDIEAAYFDMHWYGFDIFTSTTEMLTSLEINAKKDRGEDDPECMIITFKAPCIWEVIP